MKPFQKRNPLSRVLKIDIDEKRVYGLDILRALAIFFVVYAHSHRFLPSSPSLQKILYYFVFDGVGIFFVLSGFLIGGILIKTLENKTASFKTLFSFWIKRWFRTLPNYFLVLLLLMIVLPFLFHEKIYNPLEYRSYFYFLQNFNTRHPAFFGEAWSLSVEEWFYLLIPALIFILAGILKLKPKNSILIVAILATVMITGIRLYRYIHFPPANELQWDLDFRKQVITTLDAIMFGVIGAFLAFYHNKIWSRHKVILLILGITMLLLQKYLPAILHIHGYGVYKCVFSFTVTSIGTLLLIPYLSELKSGKGVFFKIFTYLSLISYSMYLINHNLMVKYGVAFLPNYFTGTALVIIQYSCYWIFTIVVSILMYKYFEKPVMKLRDRFK